MSNAMPPSKPKTEHSTLAADQYRADHPLTEANKPSCQEPQLCKWPRCKCGIDLVYTMKYKNVPRR